MSPRLYIRRCIFFPVHVGQPGPRRVATICAGMPIPRIGTRSRLLFVSAHTGGENEAGAATAARERETMFEKGVLQEPAACYLKSRGAR